MSLHVYMFWVIHNIRVAVYQFVGILHKLVTDLLQRTVE
jgi:hypothetical protein